jgi:proteasome assembly chaperone (PAC2) family protein
MTALVAAFEGWNDAGDAATDAVRTLTRATDATAVAEIDPDEFVDFQANRPQVELVGGVVRTVTWPITRVHVAQGAGHDLMLVLGHEPNFHWKGYCRAVLDVAERAGCTAVVTLGALLADTPHTRDVQITGTAADPDVMARLHMSPSRYEGPTGIVGVLQSMCRDAGLESWSLWAPVPHYAATPPSPKATRALVAHVATLLDLRVDLRRLDLAAEAWERQVSEFVAQDDEIAEYVRGLEIAHDAGAADDADDADDAERGADALASELERYLREQGDDTDD